MEEELIDLLKKQSVKKKPFGRVSVRSVDDTALIQMIDKMKITTELDTSIFREAKICDVVDDYFPRNFRVENYTEYIFADKLPDVFSKLRIKAVEDVSKGLTKATSDGEIPSLGLKIPDFDTLETNALKRKIQEVYSANGSVRDVFRTYASLEEERKKPPIDVIAKNSRSVELVYLGEFKRDNYNFFINFGDPNSSDIQDGTYSRDDVVKMLKITDEVERLRRARASGQKLI